MGAAALLCRRVLRVRSPGQVSHLLVATDVLSEGCWGASLIAVCGAEIHPGSGAGQVEDDPGYCRKCVAAALRWNTRRTGR